MRASSKRILSILISILLIIGSFIIYNSLIQPAYSEIANQRAEVATRLDLINKHEDSIKQVQNLLSQYQDTAQIQEVASLILPSEQNFPQAVNQITGLANLNKLSIELLAAQQLAIRPSAQPRLVKGIGVLRFNLQLTGAYENLKSFIQNLETNMNLMDLASVRIEPSMKGKLGENKFSYTIMVDTYYQAE